MMGSVASRVAVTDIEGEGSVRWATFEGFTASDTAIDRLSDCRKDISNSNK
jgi:hypothetical protein